MTLPDFIEQAFLNGVGLALLIFVCCGSLGIFVNIIVGTVRPD